MTNHPEPVRCQRRCAKPVASAAALSVALLTAGSLAAAEQAGEPWSVDLRYRFEHVADDAFDRNANAHTARLRLGVQPQLPAGWSMRVEGEHVENLNSRFNSTANARTSFPVVADPETTHINQAWLGHSTGPISARIGRQRILLGNQRFVGNVGWRQNEQTYDALRVTLTPTDRWAAQYAHLRRVQRIFGRQAPDPLLRSRRHRSHVFDLAHEPGSDREFGGSVYLLEDRDSPTDSSATWAMRMDVREPFGDGLAAGLRLEYARQRDYRNQPGRFGLNYWHIAPRLAVSGTTFTIGWERLGGDGTRGFRTTLATLHAFNGWADRFGNTPADGLDDLFVQASGSISGTDWTVRWHHFRAARGGEHLGREWNASLGRRLPGNVTALLKLAYHAGAGPTDRDTTKAWLQLEWRM